MIGTNGLGKKLSLSDISPIKKILHSSQNQKNNPPKIPKTNLPPIKQTPPQNQKNKPSDILGDKIIVAGLIFIGICIPIIVISIYTKNYNLMIFFISLILIAGLSEIFIAKKNGVKSKVLKVLFPKIKGSGGDPKVIFLIIFFLLIVLGVWFFLTSDNIFKSTIDYFKNTVNKENMSLLGGKIKARIANFFGVIQDKTNERIAIAKGERGIFESQVDTAINLGVEVNFDNQRTEYYYTEPAYLFGTLIGKNLNPAVCDALGKSCSEGEVIITCRTKEGLVPINGERSINIPFSQIEGLSASFQCQVPPYTRENSTTQIAQVNVLYPFRTAGYARVPFLREEVYQRLKIANQRVKTYTPQYTPGPVKISFSKLSKPITIREGTGFVNAKSFSFELENTGRGVIEDFTEITFSVPQGFESITCNTDPAQQNCNGETCSLKNTEGNDFLDRFSNLVNGKKLTINCQAIVSPSILEASSEITYDSFKVLAEYNYRAYDSMNIKRSEPKYAVQIACNEKCESEFGCVCPSSCSPGSKFISSGQTCAILN